MNKWQKGIPSKTGWYWLLYRGVQIMRCYLGAFLFLVGLLIIMFVILAILSLLPIVAQYIIDGLIFVVLYSWLVWICKQENK